MNPIDSTKRPRLNPSRIEVIDRVSAAAMRQLGGAERLRRACALSDSLRQMVKAHITREHPDWSPEQVLRELTRSADTVPG